jgi:hypothetical protein
MVAAVGAAPFVPTPEPTVTGFDLGTGDYSVVILRGGGAGGWMSADELRLLESRVVSVDEIARAFNVSVDEIARAFNIPSRDGGH